MENTFALKARTQHRMNHAENLMLLIARHAHRTKIQVKLVWNTVFVK